MNTFGERLKEERLRLQLSQEKFGELGGVQKVAQINYEAGRRTPDADYLERLAMHGVDIVYVITGERLPVDKARTWAMLHAAYIDQVKVEGTPEEVSALKGVAFMELAKHAPNKEEFFLLANYRNLDVGGKKLVAGLAEALQGAKVKVGEQ